MSSCPHHNLMLLPAAGQRLRCRHCHLTIDPEELGDSHCPECYEAHGEKRTDFETIEGAKAAVVRYRCEDCGAFIDVKG